jgi:hypothetical protein
MEIDAMMILMLQYIVVMAKNFYRWDKRYEHQQARQESHAASAPQEAYEWTIGGWTITVQRPRKQKRKNLPSDEALRIALDIERIKTNAQLVVIMSESYHRFKMDLTQAEAHLQANGYTLMDVATEDLPQLSDLVAQVKPPSFTELTG